MSMITIRSSWDGRGGGGSGKGGGWMVGMLWSSLVGWLVVWEIGLVVGVD